MSPINPPSTAAVTTANGSSSSSGNSGGGLRGLIFGPGGAAALSGIIEISVFHPFDTCSKRLMRHTRPVVVPGDGAATWGNVKSVIFAGMKVGGVDYSEILKAQQQQQHLKAASQGAAPSSAVMRVPTAAYLAHLYPGSVYAVYYKVSQRFIKFAGQPYVRDWMQRLSDQRAAAAATASSSGTIAIKSSGADAAATDAADDKAARRRARRTKLFFEASAGSLVGMGEVILLPIDRMKVLSQTNAATIRGRSLASVFASEGIRSMYTSAGTTMFRNCIGSFLLFGGSALTKEYVFGLEDYRSATVAQNLFSSAVGASMGVFATSPMDVVKTRLQSRNLLSHAASPTAGAAAGAGTGAPQPAVTAARVVADTLKAEGPQAFFKGITPKIITTAPKLIFSYTFSLYCTERLRAYAARK